LRAAGLNPWWGPRTRASSSTRVTILPVSTSTAASRIAKQTVGYFFVCLNQLLLNVRTQLLLHTDKHVSKPTKTPSGRQCPEGAFHRSHLKYFTGAHWT